MHETKQLILINMGQKDTYLAGTIYICWSCGNTRGLTNGCQGLCLLLLLVQRPKREWEE